MYLIMTWGNIVAYTVKQITVKDLTGVLLRFIADTGDHLNRVYGDKFDWSHGFPLRYTIEKHIFLVCYRDQEPIGFMIGTLNPMLFDINKSMLRQETLYAKYPRATVELLRYFIDLGKVRANDVVVCIGNKTNLKPASLVKLGFTKTEEWYRLEV